MHVCVRIYIYVCVCVTGLAGDADSVRTSGELHGLFIHLHQSDGVDVGQDPAVEAARARLATHPASKPLEATGEEGREARSAGRGGGVV